MRSLSIPALLLLMFHLTPGLAQAGSTSLKAIATSREYVDVSNIDGVIVDLKYATADNFTGTALYSHLKKAYLHKFAAAKLARAAFILKGMRPGYRFVVFDALRPRSVQWRMWEKVKGTPYQGYVANPARGSVHNYGMAVDLSIVNEHGELLDMGTSFDSFSKLSHPRLEKKHLANGQLAYSHVENRKLLIKVMEKAGFAQNPMEWWHFNALPVKQVRAGYRIVE